jgi:hypothetical protein
VNSELVYLAVRQFGIKKQKLGIMAVFSHVINQCKKYAELVKIKKDGQAMGIAGNNNEN